MQNFNTQTKTGLNSIRIDHVMITVPNYQETLEWYKDKFNATIEKNGLWMNYQIYS